MSGYLNVDLGTLERLAGDQAFAAHTRGRPGDARDGPYEVDQSGDVVRPHVEHRTASSGVIKGRIRVPALMTRTHESGSASHRLANRALIDELATCLVRATQKGVGRTTHAKATLVGSFEQRSCVGCRESHRLLGMDMLPRGQCHQADLYVRRGNRQVDDDLDRGVAQEFVDRERLEPEL